MPVDRNHKVDRLLWCSEGGHGGTHTCWRWMPGRICLTWNWSLPWWLLQIQGPPGRFLALDPLQGCRLRLDLLNLSQFSVQLCFAFLVQVLPLGVGSCEDPIEPQRGEFTFTSHLLGLQPGLHEPQPQVPLTPRMYSFLLLTHHSWHYLDPHIVLIA